MADDQPDKSQKTEEPTPKRLQEARDRGEVARSQEVNHWFILLGFTIVVGLAAPFVVDRIGTSLRPFVERPHALELGGPTGQAMIRESLWGVATALAIPFGLMVVLAIAAGLVQFGLIFSAQPLAPKLSKISPIAGFKRIYGLRALVEFAKGIAKISLVGAVIAILMWPERAKIASLVDLETAAMLAVLQGEAVRVLIGVLAVMTVIAGLDFLYQRHKHTEQLRMTRQEVRDEMKQSEGDPMIKSRLRQIRAERARRRMMSAVPTADVVVTNPTHYAVALKYDPETMGAPRVVAKGVDHIALRIRETAEKHEVPLVENRPLARALHEAVEIEQEIPPEHYRAVAEIIGYVMRLRGRMPASPGGGGHAN